MLVVSLRITTLNGLPYLITFNLALLCMVAGNCPPHLVKRQLHVQKYLVASISVFNSEIRLCSGKKIIITCQNEGGQEVR